MNHQYPVQVNSGHRVTIPKKIFDNLQLKEGDLVMLEQLQNGILEVTPVNIVPKTKGDSIYGKF